jgi:membrane-bound lytic murein transglycosylase D
LRYNYTPNRPYALNVPKGKGELLLTKIGDIPVWRPPYMVHRVRRGETLSTIARKYGASVRSIMAMNGLRSRHYIKIGWKLKIPTGKHTVSAKKISSPMSGLKIKGEVAEYVVQKGDSLWKIANRFRTKTKTLKRVNQLSSSRLQIGQVLKIPMDLISHKKRI